MYELFTDRARKVMQLASQAALRLNQRISTEHILIGLVQEGSGVAANVLKNLDVSLHKIRQGVEKRVTLKSEVPAADELSMAPGATLVIEFAKEEARNFAHNYIGTEHILLGLLREREGGAAEVLTNLDLDAEDVRAEVLTLLGRGTDGGGRVSIKAD